jgi:hypothetical protein
MNAVLPCRIITVVTFFGDRSHAFVRSFLRALDDEKNGRGPGPSRLDYLFYTGPMGVSTDVAWNRRLSQSPLRGMHLTELGVITPFSPNIAQDEDLLGRLAMRYRRVRDRADRIQVAKEYAEAVDRLIRSGAWHNAPSPEDQLPDDDMPRAFFEFWTR